MWWQILIPGFLLGLVSSFHCIGMCGPIAFLLPVNNNSSSEKAIGVLLYNTGRMVTYSCIGVFFGFAGRGIFIAGLQQGFSIVLGGLVLLSAICIFLNKRFRQNRLSRIIQSWSHKIMAIQVKREGSSAMFFLGVANGLLPCGMVYFALVGALATGTVMKGAIYMSAFGMGTMPLMILASYFKNFVGINLRNGMKRVVPFFIAGMGIFLILRGCNLNIPYISPFFTRSSNEVIPCH